MGIKIILVNNCFENWGRQ